MVVVNNPGTWSAVYPPLLHAEWHGCTPTDLIFPFFLLAVGWSMSLGLGRAASDQGAAPARWRVFLKGVRRALVLFSLGLLLAAFPLFAWDNFRIPGVLQRIALAFVGASMIVLVVRRVRLQVVMALAILVGYSLLLRWNPVQGGIRGDVSPLGNLNRAIDAMVFEPNRLYKGGKVTDPEGLLSTLPAIVSVLAGYWTGLWISARRRLIGSIIPTSGDHAQAPVTHATIARTLAMSGLVLGGLGAAAHWYDLAWNKPLWTSSYVLFTSGAGLVLIAGCYLVCEQWSWRRVMRPFEILGVNTIVVFVGSGLLARALGAVRVMPDGAGWTWHGLGGAGGARPPGTITLQQFLFQNGFLSWLEPINASLGFALALLAFWWLISWVLWRLKWIVKV
jgi:predicted acyltransferase